MKSVEIYTDGACSGNPGPGGWAAVLLYGEHVKEIYGYQAHTTNQEMELCAAVKALRALNEPCRVTLYSDSAYLVNCMQQQWYKKWQSNGWKTKNNTDVKNKACWQDILEQMKKHQIEFKKVKGHANNRWNNRCDELAVAASKNKEDSP